MGACKRLLEEVADEMGTDDISDPDVVAEAQKRLDQLAKAVLRKDLAYEASRLSKPIPGRTDRDSGAGVRA